MSNTDTAEASVNLRLGEWNSLLYKQSPPARTNEKTKDLKPTQVGFACVDAVSNRPFNLPLMAIITKFAKHYPYNHSQKYLGAIFLLKFPQNLLIADQDG